MSARQCEAASQALVSRAAIRFDLSFPFWLFSTRVPLCSGSSITPVEGINWVLGKVVVDLGSLCL